MEIEPFLYHSSPRHAHGSMIFFGIVISSFACTKHSLEMRVNESTAINATSMRHLSLESILFSWSVVHQGWCRVGLKYQGMQWPIVFIPAPLMANHWNDGVEASTVIVILWKKRETGIWTFQEISWFIHFRLEAFRKVGLPTIHMRRWLCVERPVGGCWAWAEQPLLPKVIVAYGMMEIKPFSWSRLWMILFTCSS